MRKAAAESGKEQLDKKLEKDKAKANRALCCSACYPYDEWRTGDKNYAKGCCGDKSCLVCPPCAYCPKLFLCPWQIPCCPAVCKFKYNPLYSKSCPKYNPCCKVRDLLNLALARCYGGTACLIRNRTRTLTLTPSLTHYPKP